MHTTQRIAAALAGLMTLTVGMAACDGQDATSGPTVSSPATGPSSPTPSPNPSPSPSPSPTEQVTVIEVEIRDGRVQPSPDRRVQVDRGEQVRIILTSDQADAVHVHGYDLEAAVGAGGSVTLEFVADQSGSFDVEAHELDPGLLFTLQVR